MTEDVKPQTDESAQDVEKTKKTRRSATSDTGTEKKAVKRKSAEQTQESAEDKPAARRKSTKTATEAAPKSPRRPRATAKSAQTEHSENADLQDASAAASDASVSVPKTATPKSAPRKSAPRRKSSPETESPTLNLVIPESVSESSSASSESDASVPKSPRSRSRSNALEVQAEITIAAANAPENQASPAVPDTTVSSAVSTSPAVPASPSIFSSSLASPASPVSPANPANSDSPVSSAIADSSPNFVILASPTSPATPAPTPEAAQPELLALSARAPELPAVAQATALVLSSEAPEDLSAPRPVSQPVDEKAEGLRKKSRRGRRGGRNRRRTGTELQVESMEQNALRPDSENISSGIFVPEESEDFEEADIAESPIPMPAASENSVPLSRGRNRRSNSRRRNKPLTPMLHGASGSPVSLDADDLPLADLPVHDELSDLDNEITAPKMQERKKGVALQMFISVIPDEQVEVVLTENGRVQEYYLDMMHQLKTKGNIYKGVINNIDANLQAAFVNYGAVKNGFLQIDEIHAEYWGSHHEPAKGQKLPPIQKVLKVGQEVLVQVVKEPVGSKGAFLSTYLSLPGRFLVLTPGQEQIGVSRKVEQEDERVRLRSLLDGINPGEGLGVIVRTASEGTSKTTIQKDLNFLKRVWKEILKKGGTEKAPSLLYKEQNLAERAVRDYLSEDVTEVWVDDEHTATALRELVSMLYPRKSQMVRLHQDARQSLWERFSIQNQLEQIYAREVILPSGGRLVFDQTEALMAIDINSGKTGGKTNFESMALRTNIEAAECIARQLKLRDIGGQVVIDFIEMRDHNHCRDVEKTLRNAMKNDRARHDVGRMSSFGLLELVRQRTGSSALSITTEPCPCCRGTGLRRNMEWQALQALNEIHRMMRSAVGTPGPCTFGVGQELGIYLLNRKRDRLAAMEQECSVRLEIKLT